MAIVREHGEQAGRWVGSLWLFNGGACVVALALLSACASPSPAQQADDVCASAAKEVAGLPEIHDGDSYGQILPIVTKQVATAQRAQTALTQIGDPGVHDRLLPAFNALVAATRDLQDVIAHPDRSVRYPGMPGNLSLEELDVYGSRQGLTEKANALRQAADSFGSHECGAIPWRGGT